MNFQIDDKTLARSGEARLKSHNIAMTISRTHAHHQSGSVE